MNTNGYLVLYRSIPDEVIDHLRSLARDAHNFWTPETWDSVMSDEHRCRADVPDSTARALSVDLERFYKTLFPIATAGDWEFWKTTPGANDQIVRRGFMPVVPEKDCANVCSVSGSIFIATQDNTFFYGYGWNNHVAMHSSRHLITLNKGDLILLRGDFIYSRVGYHANHVCIHGYLDTPLYVRPKAHSPEMVHVVKDSRIVDDLFCFVWNCPFKGSGVNALRKHLNLFHGMFFNYYTRPSPP